MSFGIYRKGKRKKKNLDLLVTSDNLVKKQNEKETKDVLVCSWRTLAAMVLCSSVAEPGSAVRHSGFSVHVWPSTVTRRSPSGYTLVTLPILPRACCPHWSSIQTDLFNERLPDTARIIYN